MDLRIISELEQIRQLLEAQLQPKSDSSALRRKVSVKGEPKLGNSDAPVTMIEYADYQCVFCRRFDSGAFKHIRAKLIDTGKLRFISKSMPLPSHPDAKLAAEAALCAGDQQRFWEMRSELFSSDTLKLEAIEASAGRLNLDLGRFRSCLHNGQHKSEVEKDLAEANFLQISGTPSFVIGRSGTHEVDGTLVFGAQPYTSFERMINEAAEEPKNR